jgi:serine/threonine protein kinase
MVAVKRIRLEGLKEEEIAQLMREVDLVKRLTHPSIVKYEGMARDANALSIVLEYVSSLTFPFICCAALLAAASRPRWLRISFYT